MELGVNSSIQTAARLVQTVDAVRREAAFVRSGLVASKAGHLVLGIAERYGNPDEEAAAQRRRFIVSPDLSVGVEVHRR